MAVQMRFDIGPNRLTDGLSALGPNTKHTHALIYRLKIRVNCTGQPYVYSNYKLTSVLFLMNEKSLMIQIY